MCYWCRAEAEELYCLEGASLAGSPPLELPRSMTERERVAFLVCFECARLFAELRARHDVELFEAGARV